MQDERVWVATDDTAAPKAGGRVRQTVLARVLVGCDGGRSSVRRRVPGADLCGQGGLGASLTVVFRRHAEQALVLADSRGAACDWRFQPPSSALGHFFPARIARHMSLVFAWCDYPSSLLCRPVELNY